jgi:hypothetical protein
MSKLILHTMIKHIQNRQRPLYYYKKAKWRGDFTIVKDIDYRGL